VKCLALTARTILHGFRSRRRYTERLIVDCGRVLAIERDRLGFGLAASDPSNGPVSTPSAIATATTDAGSRGNPASAPVIGVGHVA
jgi:hypothetical protein